MDYAIEASGPGKRYRRRWALAECTLAVPAGQVTGLVGPNGAGKTTFLGLAAGLLRPTAGTIRVRGRAGFVAQDAPVYGDLSVAGHRRMGRSLNDRWDAGLAPRQVLDAGLDPRQRAGRLSGGQRAQLALAVARRPELLLLDEPKGLTAGELASTCPGLGGRAAGGGAGTGTGGHGPPPQGVVTAMQECVARIAVTYHEAVTYQPASRYWPPQWYELCVFLGAALLLAGLCAWRVHRTG